jgi:high-affinity K+ transport system ATPase subunit B
MLSLSKQFLIAENEELKIQLITAGRIMLETYKGTAFDIYYVLNAITLLIISRVMFQNKIFSKATAIWGLISGILMLIPTTAGNLGLSFGIASLIPWTVFSILIAKTLFKLNKLGI